MPRSLGDRIRRKCNRIHRRKYGRELSRRFKNSKRAEKLTIFTPVENPTDHRIDGNLVTPKTNVNIMLGNVNGIRSKHALVSQYAETNKADIIVLVGTKIDNTTSDGTLTNWMKGFEISLRKDRTSRGGGLLVMASKEIDLILLEESSQAEAAWLILPTVSGPVMILAAYRPPECVAVDEYLLESFGRLSSSIKPVRTVMLGDLNRHKLDSLFS
jgi:hypothetical protein